MLTFDPCPPEGDRAKQSRACLSPHWTLLVFLPLSLCQVTLCVSHSVSRSQRCNVSTMGDFMTKKKNQIINFFLIIYFIYFIVFYTFSVWPVSSSIWRPLCDPAPQQRLGVSTKDKCGNKELLFEAVMLSAAASANSINPPNHTHSYAQTPVLVPLVLLFPLLSFIFFFQNPLKMT